MFRNNNKVFTAAPSSVGFAATFSHRAKAFLLAVPLFIRKAFIMYPSGGSMERAPAKTKKTPLVI